jgi:hypothetical protein
MKQPTTKMYLRRLALLLFSMVALACQNTSTTNSASDLDRTDNDDTIIPMRAPTTNDIYIDSLQKDSTNIKKQ